MSTKPLVDKEVDKLLRDYVEKINEICTEGEGLEATYSTTFENLLNKLKPEGFTVIYQPKKEKYGIPDFTIKDERKVTINCIETKDIGRLDNLNKDDKERLEKYSKVFPDLICTDYIEFIFYKDKEAVSDRVVIAQVSNSKITPIAENFFLFKTRLEEFFGYEGIEIKSSEELAGLMAKRARIIGDDIKDSLHATLKALLKDKDAKKTWLYRQYEPFKKHLMPSIEVDGFADSYAQTIAYGMLAARYYYYDEDEPFIREKVAEHIPKRQFFLQVFFNKISGIHLDKKLRWMVDGLASLFNHSGVKEIIDSSFNEKEKSDPMLHFYETFLKEYNPDEAEQKGVWYTPDPVVKFIVRSCDFILKKHFDLKDGLADSSKVDDKHKVQILDPAVGTGTFLAEIINHINENPGEDGKGGLWSGYVEQDLIPRLHGFEVLMAPYVIADLKLSIVLNKTGYTPSNTSYGTAEDAKRFKLYLTNSLEGTQTPSGDEFWDGVLSEETKGANAIKEDTPLMLVLGNPPYNVSSKNNSKFIRDLIKIYKEGLNETKINLDDDYIKFIRYAQYHIDNNGQGIVAMITNNSFLDGITHRQMRKSLLTSFDFIYILDLHGNSRNKEKTPSGTKDESVFDIQAGTSISIFVKTSSSKKLGKVYHKDLYGLRNYKYKELVENTIDSISWKELRLDDYYYFFVPDNRNAKLGKEYNKGFGVQELFKISSSGLITHRDNIAIWYDKGKLADVIDDFNDIPEGELRAKYNLPNDTRDWAVQKAKEHIVSYKANKDFIKEIVYKPFDTRYTYFTHKAKGFVTYPAYAVLKHMLKDNYAIISTRQLSSDSFNHVFITDCISERCLISNKGKEGNYVYPLYTYPDKDENSNENRPKQEDYMDEQNKSKPNREANFNDDIIKRISLSLGLKFTVEPSDAKETFSAIDVLDYIYGILNSKNYKERFADFLKIDYPRVPYPNDKDKFFAIVSIGSKLRKWHLMEAGINTERIGYPSGGDNKVSKVVYEDNKVWINSKQYFDGVSKEVWNFYIGSYKVADKWLKSRKNKILCNNDIKHYKKVIAVLDKTISFVKELDKIISF